MTEQIFDIRLGAEGYNIDRSTYKELGPATAVLPRAAAETATGELDYEPSWPYHQRSWLLGEDQYFTHEFDELKTTAVRRYQEGHGIDNSEEGKLGLLKEITRSKATTTNPTTCPLVVSPDGSTVRAFPAGETKMYSYAGSWDAGETITDAVAPVTDAYQAGNGELYVIDSNAAGSRVLKRTTAGVWSRVVPAAGTVNNGNETIYDTETELDTNTLYLTQIELSYDSAVSKLMAYLDGKGSGTGGSALVRLALFTDANGKPGRLVGETEYVEIFDEDAEAWVEFPFPSDLEVDYGKYWAGPLCGSTDKLVRWYSTAVYGNLSGSMSRDYADGSPSAWDGNPIERQFSVYAVCSYTLGGWDENAYDTATAVVWINGELYIVTPTHVYCHSLSEYVCEWNGGTIACTHDGALYWTDGSNKVYEYNGVGPREIIGQLPPGFKITSLFSAHARMWICGTLADGDAAAYWFGQGQYGVLAFFPAATGGTREIKAGAATSEYVLFGDSRYGGIIRHYVPEGGWSHHLAYGSAVSVPYKGLVTGAGKTFIALATNSAGTQGIYCEAATYVAEGTMTSSQMDLQMPGHLKRWTSLTLMMLPLRAGERILVEVSDDGGRTFEELGYVSTLGATSASFAVARKSPTLQYRLTLYAGTSQLTEPELVAVTIRGLPVVSSGRQWAFRIKGIPTAPGVAGTIIADGDARMQALLDEMNESVVLNFQDLFGKQYHVTAKYQRTPAYDGAQTRIGSMVDVNLEELTA